MPLTPIEGVALVAEAGLIAGRVLRRARRAKKGERRFTTDEVTETVAELRALVDHLVRDIAD